SLDQGPGLRSTREEAVVTLLLESLRELGASLFSHASVNEDVHEVRLDVPEDAGVVRDEQNAETGVFLGTIHALGDHLECVHVEAGVGLIENRELGLKQFELENLVALLLTAGEPLIHVA